MKYTAVLGDVVPRFECEYPLGSLFPIDTQGFFYDKRGVRHVAREIDPTDYKYYVYVILEF